MNHFPPQVIIWFTFGNKLVLVLGKFVVIVNLRPISALIFLFVLSTLLTELIFIFTPTFDCCVIDHCCVIDDGGWFYVTFVPPPCGK